MKCRIAGISFIVIAIVAFAWNVNMLVSGEIGYARGIVVSPALIAFGIYLIRQGKRNRYLSSIRQWARDNPNEAQTWLGEHK